MCLHLEGCVKLTMVVYRQIELLDGSVWREDLAKMGLVDIFGQLFDNNLRNVSVMLNSMQPFARRE
jgi:hypothetical protein